MFIVILAGDSTALQDTSENNSLNLFLIEFINFLSIYYTSNNGYQRDCDVRNDGGTFGWYRKEEQSIRAMPFIAELTKNGVV